MGCRLVQAATLAAFIHIVFTSEVIAQDPTDLDKDDVPGRMLTHLRKNYSGQKRVFLSIEIKNCYCWIWCGCPIIQTEYNSYLCRHENIQTGGMAAYYKERS